MKILVTSLPDIRKLAPQRFHHLLKYLSQRHEVTVLCVNAWWLKENQDDYSKGVIRNIEFHYLSERKINPVFQELSLITNFDAFKDKLNFKSFDVHINFGSLIAGYLMTKRMRSFGSPTIFDIYDDFTEMARRSPRIPYLLRPLSKQVAQFLLKKNIKEAEKITFTSGSLRCSYDLPAEKSVLIPNGVDTELFFPYPSQSLRNQLELEEDFVIGFVGFLSNWVDLEPIFATIQELSLKNGLSNVKMLVVGGGETFQENKDLAVKHGIEDKVFFIGIVPYTQVPKYISCMDVCQICFKTSSECQNSFPLKLLEYMACEKPVISTKLNGVIEAVRNRVIYASNSEELKQGILELYHNPELRQRMGLEGKKFVNRNYRWSAICHRFEEVLLEVVIND